MRRILGLLLLALALPGGLAAQEEAPVPADTPPPPAEAPPAPEAAPTPLPILDEPAAPSPEEVAPEAPEVLDAPAPEPQVLEVPPPVPDAPEAEAPPAGPPTTVTEPPPPLVERPSPPEAAPEPAPPPPPEAARVDGLVLPAAHLLPRPPRTDIPLAFTLFLAMLASAGVAALAERPLRHLAPSGLLPALLNVLIVMGRIGALLLGFMGLLHLVPDAWTPAVAYVLVGSALALGWTVRDVARDVVVGVLLTIERAHHVGQRIRMGDVAGRLERMTYRVTWLRTDQGRLVAIPNRMLATAVLEVDPEPYHPLSIPVEVPADLPGVHVRKVLGEVALLVPHLAPEHAPEICRDASHPGRWWVRVRIVDARHADAFRGALLDLADEALRASVNAHLETPAPAGDAG